ncbi:hypothetical protein BDC45DRAFT_593635 [Circinella umbellata]|nr:hypothetical protein BDC45DRAFT_593635 [Circinella umbellata]
MPRTILSRCDKCKLYWKKTVFQQHYSTCDPDAFRALSRNNVIDPEILPEAPATTTAIPFIVSGSADFSMDRDTEQDHESMGSFGGDFDDFDFGVDDNSGQEYEQRTDPDEDDDNVTDDNYMDDDNDDDEPGPSDLQEVSESIEDEESIDEYVDPWDNEPSLPTNVPIVETVYHFTELPKHAQKSYELYAWIQQFNISRDAYGTLLKMLNKWIMKEGFENIPLYLPAKSEARLERIFDVKETKYRICPKHCRLFPLNSVDPCKCNALQFKQNGNPMGIAENFGWRDNHRDVLQLVIPVIRIFFTMVAINNRKRSRRFISKQTNTQESDKEKNKEDWELIGLTSDDIKNVCQKLNLSWKKGADSGLRGVYRKDSRTTKWRQERTAKNSHALKNAAITKHNFSANLAKNKQPVYLQHSIILQHMSITMCAPSLNI